MERLVRCGESNSCQIGGVPWRIDVCTSLNKQTDHKIIPSRTSGVQGQDSIENGVDGLPVLQGVFDQANITGGCSGMKAEVGDCGVTT